MDIHKPKPWHDLREFLKEYGIIVLGVLTALGLEQVAEQIHWRHKIEQARDAMRTELADDDGPQAFARAVAAPCYDARLKALEKLASARADRQVFGKLAFAYEPPGRTWDNQAWQAAVASDVGPHMGADEQTRWATAYVLVPMMNRASEEEQLDVSALAAVRDAPGPLTELEADKAIGLIARLMDLNIGAAWSGRNLLVNMRGAGVVVGPADRADILRQARSRLGSCVADFGDSIPMSPATDSKSQFTTRKDVGALVGVSGGR